MHLPPDSSVPTLGEMQRSTPWVWLACTGNNCPHAKPVGVAAFVIRWGPDESSNRLRRAARCGACGHLGAATMHPGMSGFLLSPFPAGHAKAQ
jgi:hypothetical protein